LAVRRSPPANFLPQIANGAGKEPPTIPKQQKTNTVKSERSNNNCILVAPYQMAASKVYTCTKNLLPQLSIVLLLLFANYFKHKLQEISK